MSMLPQHNIYRIRKFLSSKSTEILVHAFVSSKLDYCNSLSYNVPKYVLKKLQSVHNAAAHLITRSRKYMTTSLQFSSIYTGFLYMSALNSRSCCPPSRLYTDKHPPTFKIWKFANSSNSLRLNPVIFKMKSYGSRAFPVAAPDLWNSLPDNIRSCDI